VWGGAQHDLVAMKNRSSFCMDSPFAYLHNHDGKALVIGLTASYGISYIHYVEQTVGVAYRYEKDFTAPYVDDNNVVGDRTYSMYVRDLDLNPQPVSYWSEFDNVMSTLGICKDYKINRVPFHLINLTGMFEVVSLDIRYNNANNLYHYKEKELRNEN
jgi:aminoglycoside 3-N-acetyltransferase